MSTQNDIRVTSKLYYYAADVTDVYDGDTITVNLNLGLGIWRNGQTIRLWKVDTPEVRGATRAEGLRVRDMVRDLILHQQVLLRTILDKRGEDQTGKFGRLLGEVLVPNARGALINVNDLLLGLGMAVPMGADGSRSRSLSVQSATATATEAVPATIACPFCGESREVTKEQFPGSGNAEQSVALFLVAQCPNCLDEARPLHEF